MDNLYNTFCGLKPADYRVPAILVENGCLQSLSFCKHFKNSKNKRIQRAISCCYVRNNIIDIERFKKFPPTHYSNKPLDNKMQKILRNSIFVRVSQFLNEQPNTYHYIDQDKLYEDMDQYSYCDSEEEFDNDDSIEYYDWSPLMIKYGLERNFTQKEINIKQISYNLHAAVTAYNTGEPLYEKLAVEAFIKYGYYIADKIQKYNIINLIPQGPVYHGIFTDLKDELPDSYLKHIVIASMYSDYYFYMSIEKEIEGDEDILDLAIKLKLKNIIKDQQHKLGFIQ